MAAARCAPSRPPPSACASLQRRRRTARRRRRGSPRCADATAAGDARRRIRRDHGGRARASRRCAWAGPAGPALFAARSPGPAAAAHSIAQGSGLSRAEPATSPLGSSPAMLMPTAAREEAISSPPRSSPPAVAAHRRMRSGRLRGRHLPLPVHAAARRADEVRAPHCLDDEVDGRRERRSGLAVCRAMRAWRRPERDAGSSQ